MLVALLVSACILPSDAQPCYKMFCLKSIHICGYQSCRWMHTFKKKKTDACYILYIITLHALSGFFFFHKVCNCVCVCVCSPSHHWYLVLQVNS